MSSADTISAQKRQGPALSAPFVSLILLAWVFVLAVWVRVNQLQSSDVGWLLSTAEWMLDGRRASIDFLEVNPPGSTLIYVPAVVLGRLSGLGSDLTNEFLVFLFAMAAAWFAAGRFAGAESETYIRLKYVTGLLIVFLILPSHAFTQREHVGTLCLIPWLAIAATRDQGAGILLRVIAGIGIGCAGLAKPHLVLVPAAVQVFELYGLRSMKAFAAEILRVENFAAGLVLMTYGGAIYFVFPDYLTNVLPRVADVYLPVRRGIFELMGFAGVRIALLLCALSLALKNWTRPGYGSSEVFVVAAAAGILVYFIQAKGFPYQIYPAVAFGFIAFGLRLADGAYEMQGSLVRACLAGMAVICAFLGYLYFDTRNAAEIKATAREIAKVDTSPRILMISGDLETGFPVTRLAHGTWVQRQPFLWMAYGAYKIARDTKPHGAQLETLKRYIALERKILAEDIVNGKPTIILIEGNRAFRWKEWAEEDPEIAGLLKGYRVASMSDWATILQKR